MKIISKIAFSLKTTVCEGKIFILLSPANEKLIWKATPCTWNIEASYYR